MGILEQRFELSRETLYFVFFKRQDGMKCFPLRALAIKQETVTVTDSAGVPVVWDGNSSVS